MTLTKTFYSNRSKLKPGSYEAAKAWLAAKEARRDEIAQTLTDEGIRLEVWILEEAEDGPYLVSLIETDDYDRAIAIYEQSKHKSDEAHRKFLEEHVVERKPQHVGWAVRAK